MPNTTEPAACRLVIEVSEARDGDGWEVEAHCACNRPGPNGRRGWHFAGWAQTACRAVEESAHRWEEHR